MTTNKFPRIDPEKCTGCGLCVPVCPDHTLVIRAEKAQVGGKRCMGCGHCVAACPQKALTLPRRCGLDFETISPGKKWLPPGAIDPGEFIRFLASRRSCRNYRKKKVAAPLLRDLVRGAITAPSGTNSQKWGFHLIPDRGGVERLGETVAGFYRRINKMAANPLLRLADRVFGHGTLENYYRRHAATVAEALAAWDTGDRDLLFHGAPALVIITSLPGASCPAEDAILAGSHLMLTAHAIGLSTCMIGFAVEAMKRQHGIAAGIGIKEEEKIHAVITVGYGKETYSRTCERKPPALRIIGV